MGVLAYEHMGDAAANGFIADEVLPVFDTAKKDSQFPKLPREAFLKVPNTKRAARGSYNRADYSFDMDSYLCEEDGWEEVVDDSEAALYSRFFDAEAIATMRAMNIIMRAREKRVADAVFNATTFSANGVTNEWDDAANATPLLDVKAGKIAIRNATGLIPNTLIISYSTFLDLGLAAEVLNRIKYTNPNVTAGEIPVSLLAQYFGVERVLVGGAVLDATAKGKSMVTATDLWSKEYAMLCYINSSSDLMAPTLGRTFLWTEDSPGMLNVETYRDETVRGDVVRVRQSTDEKLLHVACGYLLSNITT
ncbi:MAG: hypothetical protein OEQ18_01600 [Gammaproteobacteria bacterium]|nr:hypothetical protein [Gammaproteobacteria bacterium]